jgi:hypothetical protein
MTPPPTAASPGDVRTVPTDATHCHHNGFFWDVEECRWQCVTCTATGRPIVHRDQEIRP